MRLINIRTNKLEQVGDGSRTPYSILSHTWGDNEPTYQDFCTNPKAVLRTPKVHGLIELAKAESPAITYVWIDTVCIDKSSSAELQEAINSMYYWYQNATICYAYLKDVNLEDDNNGEDLELVGTDKAQTGSKAISRKRYCFNQAILNSRWFKRGWTLQELLAPRQVYFYNARWQRIGVKIRRAYAPFAYAPASFKVRNFVPLIHEATGIPVSVLEGRDPMQSCSVGQRMSWAAKRKTTRREDQAYCLMGLFGVNMPMLYGEGDAAFLRLLDEIMKRVDDHSLFAYNYHQIPTFVATEYGGHKRTLTAADYDGCAHVERLRSGGSALRSYGGMGDPSSGLDSLTGSNNNLVCNNTMEHYVMTNKGLFIELDTIAVPKLQGMLVGRLNCIVRDEATRGLSEDRVLVLPLYQMSTDSGSKVVLRTLGASLIDLPLRIFDVRTTVTRPLYITYDPFQAEMGHGSKLFLEFVSPDHPFVVSEIYPTVTEFSPGSAEYKIPKGAHVLFSYPPEDPPRRIYIRLRSKRRNLSLLVKLKIEYDALRSPSRAECSVAPMPVDKSLLELLLVDEYPEPYGPIEAVGAYPGNAVDRIKYTTILRYRSNLKVYVTMALVHGQYIRLTVKADSINAAILGENEYEELVDM